MGKPLVTDHLQRCEADGGGRNKVAGGGWVVEWKNGGIVEWWDGRIKIPDLSGRALQWRGKDGGGLICHAAGGAWPRAMSGEGWAAGKILISKCGRRQPKLWMPRMGDSGTGRQRQGFVTEEASVKEHLQRCEADGGGRNKVAGGGWVVEWQNGRMVE